jgi:protein-S-isoprenylcysteine O-methyltransferase Ste14
MLYFLDVIIAVAGYTLTLKLFDTHIRSTEPTLGGWLAALACYPPFWGLVESQYLRYGSGYTWGQWLADVPAVKLAWAIGILVLVGIYVWATVSFGIRFSNLTHRGIVTNGPYRWVKHPAYLSKNLSWWLVSVPFVVTESIWQSVVHSCALLGLNAVYYARARTEERHLNQDPAYAAYSAWIAEHGLFAVLRNLVRRIVRND